ncbi:MAG: four helix bundle protein [Saprospiraceae bacterium]
MKEGNITYEKSYAFALKVVRLYQYLKSEKKEFDLARQLLRCGTSIGANVAEANGAISNAEFSAKIGIAYKECLETRYWLSLLKDTDYLTVQQYDELRQDTEEISKILFAILRKTRMSNDKI